MARARTGKGSINTPLQEGRKATQRERLLTGMIAVANRGGYAGANVGAVIEHAGVSRPTFYDYFEDREDCFFATIIDIHERLYTEVRSKLADAPAADALAGAIEVTLEFATSQPAAARFLMNESLAGGATALHARDDGIDHTAALVEEAFKGAPAKAQIPDIPVAIILGAVHRLLATRLRRGERGINQLQEDLLDWTRSYSREEAKARWQTLKRRAAPERSPYLPRVRLRAPERLGPGRPRLSEQEVSENHRQRIMFATSEVVAERGYSAAIVSEITGLSGVDGREFYRLFADKQEAFSAVHELGFQHLMAVTAGAFFAGSSWPERIWEAFRAATQVVQENPTVANVGFVEAYAVGASGIHRVEDSRVAFAIFLQEGYRYASAGQPPSRLALEAIITAIFEVFYRDTRAGEQERTPELLADIVHLCIAPFIGVDAAERFIDAKLAETGKAARAARGRSKPGADPRKRATSARKRRA